MVIWCLQLVSDSADLMSNHPGAQHGPAQLKTKRQVSQCHGINGLLLQCYNWYCTISALIGAWNQEGGKIGTYSAPHAPRWRGSLLQVAVLHETQIHGLETTPRQDSLVDSAAPLSRWWFWTFSLCFSHQWASVAHINIITSIYIYIYYIYSNS